MRSAICLVMIVLVPMSALHDACVQRMQAVCRLQRLLNRSQTAPHSPAKAQIISTSTQFRQFQHSSCFTRPLPQKEKLIPFTSLVLRVTVLREHRMLNYFAVQASNATGLVCAWLVWQVLPACAR